MRRFLLTTVLVVLWAAALVALMVSVVFGGLSALGGAIDAFIDGRLDRIEHFTEWMET